MADLPSIISEIEQLPHFRSFKCDACSTEIRVHALQIYADCPQCSRRYKCRALASVGAEVQDIIDAVLSWAGRGEEFDAVMRRRDEILSDR
jgi:hypothetical protein